MPAYSEFPSLGFEPDCGLYDCNNEEAMWWLETSGGNWCPSNASPVNGICTCDDGFTRLNYSCLDPSMQQPEDVTGCPDGVEAQYVEGVLVCQTNTCPAGYWWINGACQYVDTNTNNDGCPPPAMWKLTGSTYQCVYPNEEGMYSDYCGQDMKYCDWLTYGQGEQIKGSLANVATNTSQSTIHLKDMLNSQQTIKSKATSSEEHLNAIRQTLLDQGVKADDIAGILNNINYKTKDYSQYYVEQQLHNQQDLNVQQDIKLGLDDVKNVLSTQELKTSDSLLTSAVDALKGSTNSVKDSLDSAVGSLANVKDSTNSVKTSVDDVKTSTDLVKDAVNEVKTSSDDVKKSVDSVGEKLDEIKELIKDDSEPPDLSTKQNPLAEKMEGDPEQEFKTLLNTIQGQFGLSMPILTPGSCSLLPTISANLSGMDFEIDFSKQGYCDFFTVLASFFNLVIGLQSALIMLARG